MNDRLLNGSGSQDLYTMLHTGDRFYHIMVWLSFCNVFAILTTNIFFNMAQFLIQWEAIPAVVSSCFIFALELWSYLQLQKFQQEIIFKIFYSRNHNTSTIQLRQMKLGLLVITSLAVIVTETFFLGLTIYQFIIGRDKRLEDKYSRTLLVTILSFIITFKIILVIFLKKRLRQIRQTYQIFEETKNHMVYNLYQN